MGTPLGAKWSGPCRPSPFRSAVSSLFGFSYFANRFKASQAKFASVCGMNRSEFGPEVHRPAPWLTQKETAHWPVGVACWYPLLATSLLLTQYRLRCRDLRRSEGNFGCVSSLGFLVKLATVAFWSKGHYCIRTSELCSGHALHSLPKCF